MTLARLGAPKMHRSMKPEPKVTTSRLMAIDIDASISLGQSPDAVHERKAAIYDLLEDNSFSLKNGVAGPYHLILSSQSTRLVLDVRDQKKQPIIAFGLSLTPFRVVVRDYFHICESYYDAVRNANPAQIETIDMARRGIHNDGSEILRERLSGKAEMDMHTARRLFTLVCSLLWQGN